MAFEWCDIDGQKVPLVSSKRVKTTIIDDRHRHSCHNIVIFIWFWNRIPILRGEGNQKCINLHCFIASLGFRFRHTFELILILMNIALSLRSNVFFTVYRIPTICWNILTPRSQGCSRRKEGAIELRNKAKNRVASQNLSYDVLSIMYVFEVVSGLRPRRKGVL